MPEHTTDPSFPGRPDSVIFLTSYFWEGSTILKGLLDARVAVTHLVIQRPWWGHRSFWRSRLRYRLNALRHNASQGPRRYHHLERMARRANVSVHYIDNVNDAALLWREDHVRLIVVAGSRIIKPSAVARFRGRLVNFHSGLLPHYRG